MGKKRTVPVTDEQIVEAYLACFSMRKASKRLGIGETTIHRVLLKLDIPRDGLARYRASSMFAGQEAEIRQEYESGNTLAELKTKFGKASDETYRLAIKRAGGIMRPYAAQRLRDGELDRIRTMHADGLGQMEISVRLNRSQSFISSVMRRYGIQRHNFSGERHSQWKGGKTRSSLGYCYVKADLTDSMQEKMVNASGYISEHRLIMARHLGRPLTLRETVHHINGDRGDNRIENLQLRQGRHGNGGVVICLDCGSHNIGHAPLAESS